jgi:hypothetical protein
VWANGPPKLAAIGFAWGPATTLPLLPFTSIRWFGETGMAGVAVSALSTSAMLILVWGEIKRLGLALPTRIVAVGLLAVHPMVVFYATNGMSEALSMLWPALVLVGLLRWHDSRSITALSIASFAAAICPLTRYEMSTVPLVLIVGVAVSILLTERDRDKARATAMFVILPVAYAIGMWMYFNWAVQGSPIWFLQHGEQLATISGTTEALSSADVLKQLSRVDQIVSLFRTHLSFATALIVVVPMAAIFAIVKRSWFALVVGTLVAHNLITALGLVVLTGNAWMTNIRFNMRTIPLVVIGGAWVIRELRKSGHRNLANGILAVWLTMLVVAIPTTIHEMRTADIQFAEAEFLVALRDRKPMTGVSIQGGQVMGCRNAWKMGDYIRENVRGRDVILADDSSAFAIMMHSGHPERFLDRVDRGDAYFLDQVNKPTKRVKYVLSSNFSICALAVSDLVSSRYPTLYEDGAKEMPLEYEVDGFKLFRIPHDGIMPKWKKADELRAKAEEQAT